MGRPIGSKNISKHHFYTVDEFKFLENECKKFPINELTYLFNEVFNRDATKKAIGSTLKRKGFKTGRNGQYTKDSIPFNKGTKGLTSANKTSFKKGNIPTNHRLIGSERITRDGYVEIKIEEPNKWELSHRIVWLREHGEIPKKHCIVFLDQDKLNVDINNLALIPRSQLLIANRLGLINPNAELTESGLLICKLIDKTNKLKKGELTL